jgi:hypothetical protein
MAGCAREVMGEMTGEMVGGSGEVREGRRMGDMNGLQTVNLCEGVDGRRWRLAGLTASGGVLFQRGNRLFDRLLARLRLPRRLRVVFGRMMAYI